MSKHVKRLAGTDPYANSDEMVLQIEAWIQITRNDANSHLSGAIEAQRIGLCSQAVAKSQLALTAEHRALGAAHALRIMGLGDYSDTPDTDFRDKIEAIQSACRAFGS